MKKKAEKALKLLLGLFGLVVIVLLAVMIPSSPQLFQGQLQPDVLEENDDRCVSLLLKTIPDNLVANQSATLIIETNPIGWPGPYTVSASSGTLVDASGNEGSLLETTDKVISFSGGDAGSTVTVQAENSEVCIGTIEIQQVGSSRCESLTLSTYPEPAPANESLEISVTPNPNDWQGSYLVTADSGKLTLSDADPTARGVNTNTLITTLNKIIYNGGSAGESITVRALGEGNERCNAVLTIGTE